MVDLCRLRPSYQGKTLVECSAKHPQHAKPKSINYGFQKAIKSESNILIPPMCEPELKKGELLIALLN